MKVLPFKIPQNDEHSFRIQIDEGVQFYNRFHHHPEIQITLIEQGRGDLLIGNTITPFQEKNIFVIGAHVPHCFKSDAAYSNAAKTKVRSISIFFNESTFGSDFFKLPESKQISSFLQLTDRGIQVKGETYTTIYSKIKNIPHAKGFERVLILLSILHHLSLSNETHLLTSVGISFNPLTSDNKNIEKVFQFISDNHQRPIKLEEAAMLINLSIPSFCRFFKLRTRKTFTRFLNEFRISVACKLLLTEEYNVSEICYQAGFSNLSNFNRKFKEITGRTPTDFLKEKESRV